MHCVEVAWDKQVEEFSVNNSVGVFEKGKSNAMVDVRACNKPIERVSKV